MSLIIEQQWTCKCRKQSDHSSSTMGSEVHSKISAGWCVYRHWHGWGDFLGTCSFLGTWSGCLLWPPDRTSPDTLNLQIQAQPPSLSLEGHFLQVLFAPFHSICNGRTSWCPWRECQAATRQPSHPAPSLTLPPFLPLKCAAPFLVPNGLTAPWSMLKIMWISNPKVPLESL